MKPRNRIKTIIDVTDEKRDRRYFSDPHVESWHGMMTAFFSLFIVLLVLLLGAAADAGIFAGSGIRSLADVVPGVRDLNIDSLGNAVSFGAILGFLAAIFGGWLGGVLAPSQALVATTPASVPARTALATTTEPVRTEHTREVVRQGRMLPSFGRKGGERVEEHTDEARTARTERDRA